MTAAVANHSLDVAEPVSGTGMELLLWILVWSELLVFGDLAEAAVDYCAAVVER